MNIPLHVCPPSTYVSSYYKHILVYTAYIRHTTYVSSYRIAQAEERREGGVGAGEEESRKRVASTRLSRDAPVNTCASVA